MGLVTTRDLLREKLSRAFSAGRAFAKHGFVDSLHQEQAADKTFEDLMDEEYAREPNLDVRKPG